MYIDVNVLYTYLKKYTISIIPLVRNLFHRSVRIPGKPA